MKRLLVFLAVFLSGLTLLVLLLGPDDIVHDTEKVTLSEEEIAGGHVAVPIPGGEGRIGVAFSGDAHFPVVEKEVTLEGGRVVKIPVVFFHSGPIEPTAEAWNARSPRIEVFPGHVPGEAAQVVITARSAIVHGHGLQDFTESMPELRDVLLAGNVVGQFRDPEGQEALRLTTEELLLDIASKEDPKDPDQRTYSLDLVRSRQPVLLQRPDGSFDLRGNGGFSLDPHRRILRMEPPVHFEGTSFSFPGLRGDRGPSPRDSSVPRVTVDSLGPMIFTGDPETRAETGSLSRPDLLVRSGTLELLRQIRVVQLDRWMETEYLMARIEPREDATDRPGMRELLAGDGIVPVRFGIGQGSGHAHTLNWRREQDRLVLEGPVTLTEMELSRSLSLQGGEPLPADPSAEVRRLSLRAAEKLVAWREGELTHVRLEGHAYVSLQGRVEASGSVLSMTLLESEDSAFEWDTLHLEGTDSRRAEARFVGGEPAPVARGHRIEAHRLGENSFRLDLLGDAEIAHERGVLQGPTIAVTATDLQKSPPEFSIHVPQLTHGDFEVPALTVLPGLGAAPPPDGGAPEPPGRLRIHPQSPTSYTLAGPEHLVDGRCVYLLVRHDDREEQRFACDTLRAIVAEGGRPELHLQGQVDFTDLVSGARIEADRLDYRAELLEIRGADAPAFVRVPLQLRESSHLVELRGHEVLFHPDERRLRAVGTGESPAELQIPESLLQAQATPADAAPMSLRARSLELLPGESSEDPTLRRLEAVGTVILSRPSDGLFLKGERLLVLPEEGVAHLEGRGDDWAVMRRPVAGHPEAVDELHAASIDFLDHGRRVRLARDARTTLYLASRPEQPGRDDLMRLALHSRQEMLLEGRELTLGGGVTAELQRGTEQLKCRSDRLEVILDQPLVIDVLGKTEKVTRVRPTLIRAVESVELEHPSARCECSLLIYDLKTGWIQLMAGSRPGKLSYDLGLQQLESSATSFQQWNLRFPTRDEWF